MSFWDLLRPSPPAKSKKLAAPVTAAELRQALAEAEAEARDTEASAAGIATDRAAQLILATEAEADELDRALQLAQRAADRAALAVEQLRQRLATAEQAERQAGFDQLFAEGQAAVARGLTVYRAYHKAAVEMARLLEQMADVADEVEKANSKLSAAGDPRTLGDLDRLARPSTAASTQHQRAPWALVELPSGEDPDVMLWPLAPEGTPIDWGNPDPGPHTSSGHHDIEAGFSVPSRR